VPQPTLARLESDHPVDPHFGTVVALVRAAGGEVRIVGRPIDPLHADELHGPLGDEPRDAAGRRYPAHLDVRAVHAPDDWWGAWWASTTGPWFTRERWPRAAPTYTFDVNRGRRDAKRHHDARRRAAARAEVRRLVGHDPAVCVLVALIDAVVVGWLVASFDPALPTGRRGATLHRVEVHPAWRRAGVGRALVGALRAELIRAGVRVARATVDTVDGPALLLRVGFRRTGCETLRMTIGQALRRTS
jgi:ribosomal protein S18 acetylase RimI-like enzyme